MIPSGHFSTLFVRGQKFFNDNIFALLLSKFLGLLTVLSIPSIVRILIYTKMSGSPITAYKRYMATVLHMVIWYRSDFTPGSKLWQSVTEVRNKHNSASKRCCTAGLGRFSQKDMALTQFGFMGYALAMREKIGLHGATNEDLQGLVHVWRVIGYVMGVEDRFNICRDSVDETTAICRTLAYKVFKPAIEKKDKDFIEMATYLSDGMWSMNPTLNAKIYINMLYKLLKVPNNNNNNLEKEELSVELNFLQRMILNMLIFVVWTLQFTIPKLYHNYTQYISLWLMRVFPFLAYYQFGYSDDSHVYVLRDNKTN